MFCCKQYDQHQRSAVTLPKRDKKDLRNRLQSSRAIFELSSGKIISVSTGAGGLHTELTAAKVTAADELLKLLVTNV